MRSQGRLTKALFQTVLALAEAVPRNMDRWQDADDDITPVQHHKGRVARMGIAGFVQAAVSAAEQSVAPDAPQQGIVIVDSKREQRAAAARSAMPPPPAIAPQPPAVKAAGSQPQAVPSLPRPAVPDGSVAPPPDTMLMVHKADTLIQKIVIGQVMTVFGRLPCNDIVLDHPSSSRQHAALTFRTQQQQQQQQQGIVPVLSDLGSAHGTFINGKRITRGQPCPLTSSDTFTFGASTRSYSIQLPQHTAAASTAGKKRGRVTFAGQNDDEPDGAVDDGSDATGKRQSLEQLIGYSDGKQFTPKVGPQPADASELGKFAHMLEAHVTIVKPKTTTLQPEKPMMAAFDGVTKGGKQQQQQQESIRGAAASGHGGIHADHQQQPGQSGDILQQFQRRHPDSETSSSTAALQQQQGVAAAGVLRSWSGGASRALLPPQLARKNSNIRQDQQQQKQQPKQNSGGIGSGLYDQLPQTARSGTV